jgi:hypothetical protein
MAGRLDVAVGDGHEHRGVGGDALSFLVALDALGREVDVDDQRLGRLEQVDVEVAEQLVVRELGKLVKSPPDQALGVEGGLGAGQALGDVAERRHAGVGPLGGPGRGHRQ